MLDLLSLAVAAAQVQVESRRLARQLGDTLKAQVQDRSALDGEPGLEAVRFVGQPLTSERRFPEPAQPLRVDGVDDKVLQIHAHSLCRSQRALTARGGDESARK